ncbi:MAG: amidohydrolase [Anaerolineae bacterium]|jgi:5-methylthioadenosine/S-adenosylhomocysteine deaminase
MTNLLIQNGFVLTMDEAGAIHAPGWVWVEGAKIAAAGGGSPPPGLAARAGRTIDARHMAVLPGMVNGHTHLSQTFVRGLADDKPLLAWLKQIMWPIQAAITPEDMRLASLLGLVENLRCGVTAVVQHHKISHSPAHVDAAAGAAEAVGLRMLLARGWVDLGDAGEPPEAIVEAMTRLRGRWHGAAGGRITVGFGPLAPWRCSDDTMRRTVALARRWGLPTHLHVAETEDEIEMLQARTGLRHVEWLQALDALGPDVHLVHGVWLDEGELDLVAASGAVVVHCPVSNMYLASGVPAVCQMLARGIPVALGTDGPGSQNSQDMLESLKVAALLAKVSTCDANAVLPLDLLRMATVDGARLLGRDDIGRIVPGARADLALVDLNNARSMPVHRPESALVYNASGGDVHTVLVEGRILLDAGQVTVLDEGALLEKCRRAAQDLLRRAGVEIWKEA